MEPMSEDSTIRSGWGKISPSTSAMRITNPIRDIVDKLKLPENPTKPPISLSIGDPTVFGNLLVPPEIEEALIENIKSHTFNGYTLSHGYPSAKKSIADKYHSSEAPLSSDDVVIASGCSGALEIAIGALVDEGDNVLIPAPGFSLYQTICAFRGVEPRFYRLNPASNWEVDLADLSSKIDSRTACIIVNNPSNPCGSVYSREHLQHIVQIADKYHIPIVADEIYRDLVFEGHTFTPIASLTSTVPVLSVGGIAKVFMVPGWRLGWILIHDRNNVLSDVRTALTKLSQLILGANTLIQSVVGTALNRVPASYFKHTNATLSHHARILSDGLERIDGLSVVRPGGAMYMMVGIEPTKFKDIPDDVEFARLLVAEENLIVLPASIFQQPNYVRLVICPPPAKLEEAVLRIEQFCSRHRA